MRVNLFIIGAMKGGTHAAHAVLGSHPAVAASNFKEPSHFVAAEELRQVWPKPLPYQDADAYRALFDVRPETRYLCEASTRYSTLPDTPGVADRIHAYNPDARLVYMVRDPLRRIISQFFQERRTGRISGSFADIVRASERFVAYSDYAMQIAPFLALFPRENIRIVVSERFMADTEAEAGRLFEWLDLDPAQARFETSVHHPTPDMVGVPGGLLKRVPIRRTSLWQLGRRHAPVWLEHFVKAMLYNDNLRPRDIRSADIDEDIRARVAANACRFYELIGGPVPEWRDTNEAIARYAG
ncbi:MAG: sulfotransferase [Sphingomonadales bacterium]